MNEIQESYSSLSNDPRWTLTQRVAHSEGFRRAPRLRAFLLYVVERKLASPGTELNEYQIATTVFDRPPSFNPAEESIVRSSARQLRAKLQEFFEGEGRGEHQVLVIPKGTYVPEFVERGEAQAPPPDAVRPWRLATLALAAVAAVLGVLVWQGASRPRRPAPDGLVFSVFPPDSGEIQVTLCDSALVAVNGFLNRVLSVDEYARRVEQTVAPLPDAAEGAASPKRFPGGRLITSFRDAAFLASLAERGLGAGYRFGTAHARLRQSRDFRTGHHILLGSSWSNPWTALFEEKLNFRFVRDAQGRFGILNASPLPGEQPFYYSSADQAHNGVSWALIAVAPNLSGSGRALLLAGIHTESSEGASEAALSGEFAASVRKALGGAKLDALRVAELLVEVRAVDGTVQGQKLVAWRVRQ
jgi:hypothetical protein